MSAKYIRSLMKHKWQFSLFIFLLLYDTGHSQSLNIYQLRADTVARALQRIETATHLWQRAGWWNCANIFESKLDQQRLSGHRDPICCQRLFKANMHHGYGKYQNEYYDDNGWWALAWTKAYDVYHRKEYLAVARGIFADMEATGRDSICGGGMAWHRTKRYKNAITNELYILLAARLAQSATDSTERSYYLRLAINNWNWLRNSGMMNSTSLFNDGLGTDCRNNNGVVFTYNQGVIIGGLKELYLLTDDTTYLATARGIALSAIKLLSDSDGILTEKCCGKYNQDIVQFKGIFIKNLGELNAVLHDEQIKQYIRHNADCAWAKAQNKRHLFTYRWQGPADDWWGSATGVALDLMNAAAGE